jgi:hypothetical protein
MSADPLQINPTIQYPNQWVPKEYLCRCGKKIRVDSQFIAGPFAAQVYQHNCGKDEEHYLSGTIIASWEEHNGAWVIVGRHTS